MSQNWKHTLQKHQSLVPQRLHTYTTKVWDAEVPSTLLGCNAGVEALRCDVRGLAKLEEAGQARHFLWRYSGWKKQQNDQKSSKHHLHGFPIPYFHGRGDGVEGWRNQTPSKHHHRKIIKNPSRLFRAVDWETHQIGVSIVSYHHGLCMPCVRVTRR